MLIAANKADLCEDLGITDEIHKNRDIVNCSAETELVLKKAAKANMIDYIPGNEKFVLNKNMNMSSAQKEALKLVENVLSKLNSTGIQTALNYAVFRTLKMIVVIHQDIAKGFLFAIDVKTKQRIGADHQ